MNPLKEATRDEASIRQLVGGPSGALPALSSLPRQLFQAALASRRTSVITGSVEWIAIFEQLESGLGQVLGRVLRRAARGALRAIGPRALDFTATALANQLAIDQASLVAGHLERGARRQLRVQVRRALRRMRRRSGLAPFIDDLAGSLATNMSLTPKQTRKIEVATARRLARGMPQKAAQRMELRARSAALKTRARAWASDIVVRAVNQGRLKTWLRAASLLGLKVKKVSRHRGDRRVRDGHRRQAAQEPIGLDSLFQIYAVSAPPFERGCRCWLEVRFAN